ncbi:MAG: hypothetical protein QME44_04485 [Thermodesulfobacteriota bacterium]|nr:hypothetical protein [Thermodesulfobacteriota bacterium]
MFCTATYIKRDVKFIPGKSPNRRLVITLVNPVTYEPEAKATVNVPEAELSEDEIIIKDWSENEGMLEFFLDNGLAIDTGRTVGTGQVIASVVKITDKLRAELGI